MSTKTFSLLSIPTPASTDQVVEKFPFSINHTQGQYSNIEIICTNNKFQILYSGVDIKSYSFVWLSSGWRQRDLAYTLGLYLKESGTPHTTTEHAASKITDTAAFQQSGLPIPDSIYVDRNQYEQKIDLIIATCGLPLIIKDTKGSQGKDSFLITSKSELQETFKKLPKRKKFMFQGFIQNDYDWGVMVANGVVVSGEKSYAPEGEFRNNLKNGAVEKFINVDEIPDNIKEIAIAASSALGLTWSRADIIIDKETGNPYLLEVNRYPGITANTDEAQGAYTYLKSHIAAFA